MVLALVILDLPPLLPAGPFKIICQPLSNGLPAPYRQAAAKDPAGLSMQQ